MDIFLAYSDNKTTDAWISIGQGQIELDPESTEFLADTTKLSYSASGNQYTIPLGKRDGTNDEVVFAIRLSNLASIGDHGKTICFQAIAIPVGEQGDYLWDQAWASEVDAFVIDRFDTEGGTPCDPSSQPQGMQTP